MTRKCHNRGGGGVLSFFYIHRLGPSIYRSPPKNIRNFKHPQKIFEILATLKNTPILYIYLKKKTLKCIELTPEFSPILLWPQKNIHKIFIPKKYSFFWKPPKILKFKILNPKKCPEPTYLWKYQSTPPGINPWHCKEETKKRHPHDSKKTIGIKQSAPFPVADSEGFQGVSSNPLPCTPFLNNPMKWNYLVSVRPNYFIFMEYLRKMR